MSSTAGRVMTAMLAAIAMPAAAQVRVVVDGRVQDVPAGIIRTITHAPGGPQRVRDEPFGGATAPGYATITTTETTESDEDGTDLQTTVVTRIEPMMVAAVSYTPIPAPAVTRASDWEEPTSDGGTLADDIRMQVASDREDQASHDAPHLDLDPAAFGADRATAPSDAPLRIRRDGMTGHFIATVYINGVRLRAIVDTGAQQTVLSSRDAKASGADRDIVRATPMSGIGGTTMLNVARVRSMDVGGQHLGSFTACIGAEGIPYTLLGQTEINRLGRIVIEDGVMTITPRPATAIALR